MDRQTIVFLGPSLPHTDARAIVAAEFHPPARMGDIYRLMSARVARFVIIDGVFHGVPSVWHREILDAMAEGIEVIGASSMGALRAAELHRFGMHGHGVVFEWYRDGVIDGDDEVALMHGDAEAGYRALSDPLVNLRATLAAFVDSGLLATCEHDELLCWLKARHYPERSLRALEQAPLVSTWSPDRQTTFRTALRTAFRDVKRDDAKGVLAWCAQHPCEPCVREYPDPHRPERAMWRIGRVLRGTTQTAAGSVTGETLLQAHAPSAAIDAALARRAFLVAWARQRGVSCPIESIERAHLAWQRERRPEGLDDGEFLASTGLTAVRAQELLSECALATWLIEQGPTAFGLAATESDDPALAFIRDWANWHGIDADPAWVLAQGPAHFGLPFHRDASFVEHLRLSGDALV